MGQMQRLTSRTRILVRVEGLFLLGLLLLLGLGVGPRHGHLDVADGRVGRLLGPLGQLLVPRRLVVDEVRQRRQLELVPV